jgi:cullin 1
MSSINLEENIINFNEGSSKINIFFNNLINNVLNKSNAIPINNKEYINVYTLVYNLCIQREPYNYVKELYELHTKLLKEFMINNICIVINNNNQLLYEFKKYWDYFKIINKWMSLFFSYVDRFYTVEKKKLKLKEMGNRLFLNIVYKKNELRIIEETLQLIKQKRDNEDKDYSIIKQIIIIIELQSVNLSEYYSFEKLFLEKTEIYYKNILNNYDSNITIDTFLQKSEQIIENENNLINFYLNSNTKDKLNNILNELLIKNYLYKLLVEKKRDIFLFLQNKNYIIINRIYNLLIKVPLEFGLNTLNDYFYEFIKMQFLEIIKNIKEDNNIYIYDEFIKLLCNFTNIVKNYLHNNTIFNKTIKISLTSILNNEEHKIDFSSLLAKYCDNFIKKSGKSDIEKINLKINEIINMFSYLNDKDYFKFNYIKLLSKRLLKYNSISDIEKMIISKFKLECGSQYTTKLEGMCNDLILGKNSYKGIDKELYNKNNIDCSTTILTLGFWSNFYNIKINIPKKLNAYKDFYDSYYREKNKNRKLSWAYSLCNNDINMIVNDKKYYFVSNTLQTTVLMLFNEYEKLSFNDILNKTGIIDNKNSENSNIILKKVLHPLLFSKYRILKKESKKKNISDNDVFFVNKDFKSKNNHFKIPMVSLEDNKKTVQNIDLNRKVTIEACIVRIMKTRKELSHNNLITEVFRHINLFKPTIKLIKKCIESLVEKEYIERSSKKLNHYIYLA